MSVDYSTRRIVEHFSLCQAYWCILMEKINKGGIPVHSLYLVLGLDDGASEDAVRAAYARIRSSLEDPSRWEEGSLGRIQAHQCLLSIEHAYATLTDPVLRSGYEADWKEYLKGAQKGEVQPKLGQLCVAAGIITIEQLEQAVESQTSMNVPLGQVLQQNKLISQTELDGLLLGQQLIRLPMDAPHSVGQRLMAIDLVTEDMVRVALIEQRTFDRPLEDLLVLHGWLDQEILKILLGKNGTSTTKKPSAKGKTAHKS